jgi:hypothetical protein
MPSFIHEACSYLHAWNWTGDGNFLSNHFAKNCDPQDVSVFDGKGLFPHDATYHTDMVEHSRALGKKVSLSISGLHNVMNIV